MIDILFAILLISELLRGLKRGFVAEAGTIIGILAGFYIATALNGSMSHLFILICSGSVPWSSVFGFLFTFLVIFLLFAILAKIFEGILGIIALGGVNRLAGGAFCLLKSVLVLSIVLNLYETIDQDRSFVGTKHIESSLLYKPVLNFAPSLFPLFGSVKSHPQPETSESNDSKKITI